MRGTASGTVRGALAGPAVACLGHDPLGPVTVLVLGEWAGRYVSVVLTNPVPQPAAYDLDGGSPGAPTVLLREPVPGRAGRGFAARAGTLRLTEVTPRHVRGTLEMEAAETEGAGQARVSAAFLAERTGAAPHTIDCPRERPAEPAAFAFATVQPGTFAALASEDGGGSEVPLRGLADYCVGGAAGASTLTVYLESREAGSAQVLRLPARPGGYVIGPGEGEVRLMIDAGGGRMLHAQVGSVRLLDVTLATPATSSVRGSFEVTLGEAGASGGRSYRFSGGFHAVPRPGCS